MGRYLEILSAPRPGTTDRSRSYADDEWDRFLAVSAPRPDGLGLYDPSDERALGLLAAPPVLAGGLGAIPSGWSLAGYRCYVKQLAEACEPLHPARSVCLRRMLEHALALTSAKVDPGREA